MTISSGLNSHVIRKSLPNHICRKVMACEAFPAFLDRKFERQGDRQFDREVGRIAASWLNSSLDSVNNHPNLANPQTAARHDRQRLVEIERRVEQQMRQLLSVTETVVDVDCRWHNRFMPREV